jgi:hypothetical protein
LVANFRAHGNDVAQRIGSAQNEVCYEAIFMGAVLISALSRRGAIAHG